MHSDRGSDALPLLDSCFTNTNNLLALDSWLPFQTLIKKKAEMAWKPGKLGKPALIFHQNEL